MSGGVRVEYRYDGLVLACDTASVARIHALLRVELAVVAPVPDGVAVRHITIRPDVPTPELRMGWVSTVCLAVGSGVSVVAYVAGWVALVGWVWG